ncbi:FKBP-type peptidyl-prolyl cis-trans isomerase [Gaetbulibacter aestuarii]|uniref:Peptidyl-prolyl cis-trans isomerase n=1 Tax=Gaetbulibacter aestuarii TaxID=1502358 RepID=A0ABW7MZT2_9FLAO
MKLLKVVSFLTVTLVLSSCNNRTISNKPLKTEIDSVSYALGANIAKGIKANASELDHDLVMEGLMNVLDSTDQKIAADQVQPIIQTYFQKKQMEEQEKQREEAQKKAEEEFGENKAAGEKFLEENKKKDGVKVTADGLQYEVIKEGSGDKPNATSTVEVNYKGMLIDGTVFDSSYERGKPSQFRVNQVIKGWTEGLQMMPVGSKYKFYIPQDLAYGFQQRGQDIKPFSALVFEVELLDIVKK